jgi:Ca2+-binding EF-hand superfamily protein
VILEELVKGSVKKRIQALFNFYDTDRKGSVSYAKILEMVEIM